MESAFLGYHRPDGRVGVRNHLLVLATGGLTGPTARRIAAAINGAVSVVLPYGVGLVGRDEHVHFIAAVGLATHPNVGAALLIGDNPRAVERLAAAVSAAGKLHAALSLDDC